MEQGKIMHCRDEDLSGGDLPQKLIDHYGIVPVQCGDRFICKDDIRIFDQCADDCNALAFT